MNIEVILSPLLYDTRLIRQNHITVVVDVLRASTAICAAFMAGAAEVVPLSALDVLPSYYERGYTIAAERGGQKVALSTAAGRTIATCGNSPTEYLSMDLTGRRLAYSTTNGTVAITQAHDSKQVVVGCFANLSAVAHHLRQHDALSPSDVVILCAGWHGDPSIEDSLFAGALTARLAEEHGATPYNDAATMAADLWHAVQSDLPGYCRKACHVHRLHHLHYDDDIRFALRIDTCNLVPQLINDSLYVK